MRAALKTVCARSEVRAVCIILCEAYERKQSVLLPDNGTRLYNRIAHKETQHGIVLCWNLSKSKNGGVHEVGSLSRKGVVHDGPSLD